MAPVLLDNLADVTKGYGGADLRVSPPACAPPRNSSRLR